MIYKQLYLMPFLLVVVTFTNNIMFGQITEPEASEVWEPQPRVVSMSDASIPSDAIVLFDGTNLDSWEVRGDDNKPAAWTIEGDHMTVAPGTGDIQTKESFGSIQLHLEFRTPALVESEGQGRGNSGVFFQKRYEVQILDNYNNKTYANGQAAAVYKQHIPLVNACRAPGEWQKYDIIFEAPVFNKDGLKVRSGYFTVFHNGILVQNHVEIYGTTEYIGFPKNVAHGEDKIMLQDHGNTMSFRNIWVRRL